MSGGAPYRTVPTVAEELRLEADRAREELKGQMSARASEEHLRIIARARELAHRGIVEMNIEVDPGEELESTYGWDKRRRIELTALVAVLLRADGFGARQLERAIYVTW